MKTHAHASNVDLMCPVDREAVLQGHVFPDRAAARRIGNLRVECGNRERGCTWVDDLRDLEDHEEGCDFKFSGGTKLVVQDGKNEGLSAVLNQMMVRLEKVEGDFFTKSL